jgi:hypothetical protein
MGVLRASRTATVSDNPNATPRNNDHMARCRAPAALGRRLYAPADRVAFEALCLPLCTKIGRPPSREIERIVLILTKGKLPTQSADYTLRVKPNWGAGMAKLRTSTPPA